MKDYSAYIDRYFPAPNGCVNMVTTVWADMFNHNIIFNSVTELMTQLRMSMNKVEDPQEGDMILINHGIWHVGLVIGKGQMLHTDDTGRVIVERYDGWQWKNHIRGYYRWTLR